MTHSYRIPPLISGGIILTYRCTNACRHCLYRCSPARADEWMSEELIDRTFEALAEERSLHGIHLAGGEATIDWDRLEYAIRSAVRHGISIDYLETNGHWCIDEETAVLGFQRLRQIGLPGVLVSASLFHNEFIPLARTKAAIAGAIRVFGLGGLLIWTPDVLELMEQHLDDEKTHTLAESCKLIGIDPESSDLWRLHNYLTPGGRAAEKLSAGLATRPAEAFEGDACGSTLDRTAHFHIDPDGRLFTGHCPGISAADVHELHPEITPDTHPIYTRLYDQGPCGLLELVEDTPFPDGTEFVSKCHLCLEIRKVLAKTGRFQELAASGFYGIGE